MPALRLSAPSRPDAVVVDTPVVLAPMAGVTNAAFRELCSEQGAGLYVCEMITSRGLVERDRKSLDMLAFSAAEQTRSVQLYGVDPATMAAATRILCEEFGVAHVDINFGCPVPKVTRKGGGGVLPWKRDLMAAIVSATVRAADAYGVPVTVKTRMGIDADHLYYRDAGRIAEDAGAAGICLHGRTVAQAYAGDADREAMAELASLVSIPVLGNGDIWEGADAIEMIEQTGVAAVEVGRGCLGRPWLFRDLADACAGQPSRTLPRSGEVAAMFRRHGQLLAHHMGERRGVTDLRKHVAWYFKGFPIGGEVRRRLAMVSDLAELDQLLAMIDPDLPFPEAELGAARGRQGSPRGKVAMPEGWLADTCGMDQDLAGAELGISGG